MKNEQNENISFLHDCFVKEQVWIFGKYIVYTNLGDAMVIALIPNVFLGLALEGYANWLGKGARLLKIGKIVSSTLCKNFFMDSRFETWQRFGSGNCASKS